MSKHVIHAAAIALAGLAGTADAAVVSVFGDVTIIPAPAEVNNSAPFDSSSIQVFNEVQGFELLSDLALDSGTIGAGTVIDSHMFFLNKKNDEPGGFRRSGWMTFGGAVLGIIGTYGGLAASDYLGAPTTYSFAGVGARGLESNDFVSFAGNTVTANLKISQPGDWVRVITVAAVPVPASAALLPLGLAALAGLRRRRRARA